jgi:hypothetical protein
MVAAAFSRMVMEDRWTEGWRDRGTEGQRDRETEGTEGTE